MPLIAMTAGRTTTNQAVAIHRLAPAWDAPIAPASSIEHFAGVQVKATAQRALQPHAAPVTGGLPGAQESLTDSVLYVTANAPRWRSYQPHALPLRTWSARSAEDAVAT